MTHHPDTSRRIQSRTRRQFLRNLLGGAAAIPAIGVHASAARSHSTAPSEKLQIAAIGVWNRGRENIIGCSSEDIVALCDVDEPFLDRMGQQFPAARRYVDFRRLLDEERSLDAVVISTPDHTHYPAALMALRRKLHVYCEKPLAHSVFEVRELARAAREANVVTQMGNQHHASPGYRRVVQLVQAGLLGDVREVHCWTDRPLWPQGIGRPEPAAAPPSHLHWDLWLGPAPERPYAQAYHPFQWRGFWDFGTGALGDMGPHLIDPAFAALRLTHPRRITAESAPVNAETAPEWSVVRFEFPLPGPVGVRDERQPAAVDATLKLTWYDGDRRPPMSVTGAPELPTGGALLVGSRAKLFAPELGGRPILIPHDKRDRVELPAPWPAGPGHYQEWLTACKSGGKTSSDFDYAARLTEACLLGNVAIRAGRPVNWDAGKGVVADDPEAARYLQRPYRSGWIPIPS